MPKINRQVQILKLRERYFKALHQDSNLVDTLNEAEIGEHVYNSNAIENSTLSLDDTEKILQQIKLDRYAEAREINEAVNLAQVMKHVHVNCKKEELDAGMILKLHKILLTNIDNDIAGRFRNVNERVRVGAHIAPKSEEINLRIFTMFSNYYGNVENDIVKKIAKFHLEFEYIHPFCDGNGRIGRVLNNYLLIREGFVPINIKFIDRQKYYNAFKEFQTLGKTGIMEDLVEKALLVSYHKRLAYMEGKRIINLSEYAKQNKLSLSNLINKAHKQSIEAFLELGVWKIGV